MHDTYDPDDPADWTTEALVQYLRGEAGQEYLGEHPSGLFAALANRLEALTTQSEEDPEAQRRRMVDQHPHCVVTGHSLNYSNAVLITATNASPAIVHADGVPFTLELLRQLDVQGVQVHPS